MTHRPRARPGDRRRPAGARPGRAPGLALDVGRLLTSADSPRLARRSHALNPQAENHSGLLDSPAAILPSHLAAHATDRARSLTRPSRLRRSLSKFALVINLKRRQALGLTITPSVRIARQQPVELKGARASVVCWGVMRSGMLRYPLSAGSNLVSRAKSSAASSPVAQRSLLRPLASAHRPGQTPGSP